ncbi:MAG TPA: hypothetical protein PKK10_10770 [Woeseiaceae bacterium]|nr:hypothetical protein [Woeseiaceae bacterium]
MFGYSEKKLAKDIGKITKRMDSDFHATYSPETRTVDINRVSDVDAPPYSLFLGNLFLKVRDMDRKGRESTLKTFVTDVIYPRELTADELLASMALRTRTPFDLNLRRQLLLSREEPPEPVIFGEGDLLLELVADSAESVSTISTDKLSELSISREQAYKTAVARLVRATLDPQWRIAAENIWASVYEDDYDFARLIAEKDHVKLPFDGPAIAFSPSHTICLVTNRSDDETLSQMVEIGDQLSESHRPFSQLLWTKSENCAWKPLTTPDGTDGSKIAILQSIRERISQYADQKVVLESRLSRLGEDSFVATYEVFERPDGFRSICTYTLHLPSYLPEADEVALVDLDGVRDSPLLGMVTWDDFSSTLGPSTLIQLSDYVPVRYDLTTRLTKDQEDTLRNLVKAL